jgi:hypothetical protein
VSTSSSISPKPAPSSLLLTPELPSPFPHGISFLPFLLSLPLP